MLYQLAFILILLTSLQPGKPQEDDVSAMLQSMNTLLGTLVNKSHTQLKEMHQLKTKMEDNIRFVREELNSLGDSLQAQKEQTAYKLAELQSNLTHQLQTIKGCNERNEMRMDIPTPPTTPTTPTNFTLQPSLPPQPLQPPPPPPPFPTISTYTCGGTGGWRRVVYLDMTDSSTTCPSGWQLTGYSKRTCGKGTISGIATCYSVTFPVAGGNYSRVCGRIKAYQYGYTDAFEAYHDGVMTTIDSAYVSGISVTRGSPRQHIWTFAAGSSEDGPPRDDVCPCDGSLSSVLPPSFVGQSFFCESGVNMGTASTRVLYSNDPLWDGEDCGFSSTCCSFNTPPYFIKQLPTSTSDDIEARLCLLDPPYDDVAVELVELYVQ